MEIELINRGLTPDSPVADTLREGALKINENFTALAAAADNIDIVKFFPLSVADTFAQILTKINALEAYAVDEKTSVWFVGNSLAGGGGVLPRTVKFKMMNKGAGNYGAGGTALASADIEMVYSQAATVGDIETVPQTDIINFGTITGETVADWLNAADPALVIQAQDAGYTLFKGTVDSVAVAYLWIGAAGTYGDGETQCTMADFQLIPDTVQSGQNNVGFARYMGELEEGSALQAMRAKMNAISFTILDIHTPVVFSGYRYENGVAVNYRFFFMNGKGDYGIGGQTVLPGYLNSQAPERLLPSDIEDGDFTQIIPLGEIEEGGFLAAANAEERDLADDSIEYFFTYIFADVVHLVQFIGANGVYGDGGTPLVGEDFTAISDSETPPAVPVTVQMAADADNETNTPIFFLDAGNESKMRASGRGLTYQKGGKNISVEFDEPVADVVHKVPAKEADDVFAFMSDVAGVGGVQSVTGEFVDNTDPLNPVVNTPDLQSVMKVGSEASLTNSPVSIENINTEGENAVLVLDNSGRASILGFESARLAVDSNDGITDFIVFDDRMRAGSDNPVFEGVVYEDDYSANYIPRSLPDVEWVETQIATKANLDINGKVPLSEINDALLGNNKFMGLYDGTEITASPDTDLVGEPLPTADADNNGWYFISTGAYTNGGDDYNTGDWIISVGSSWEKVDNTDAVSSVAGLVGTITAANLKTALAIAMGDVSGLTAALALLAPLNNPSFTGNVTLAALRAASSTYFEMTMGGVSTPARQVRNRNDSTPVIETRNAHQDSTGHNQVWSSNIGGTVADRVIIHKNGDVELLDVGVGLIAKSPNGSRWRLTPSNAGASVWTAL